MNKLYIFCALVFLTACGSSGIDGSWTDVEDANSQIDISGENATLIDGDFTLKCGVVKHDDVTYTLGECEDDGSGLIVILNLVDGNLLVTIMGERESRTFVRK